MIRSLNPSGVLGGVGTQQIRRIRVGVECRARPGPVRHDPTTSTDCTRRRAAGTAVAAAGP